MSPLRQLGRRVPVGARVGIPGAFPAVGKPILTQVTI